MHIRNVLRLIHDPLRTGVRTIRRGWPIPIAMAWRRILRPQHVVAVTGSGGKSTTVTLIGGILSLHGPTRIGRGANTRRGVARNILRARPSDRYLVQEVSGHEPGAVMKSSALLRHDVAVVTTVGTDHRKAFSGDIQAIAEEKGGLVRLLAPRGIAVLNADDPLVMTMAGNPGTSITTFGSDPRADIRVLEYCSEFPGRLSLTVTDGQQTAEVKTQFVGSRWITAVLAAIACGRALGIDLDDCVRAIETIKPSHGRDSVHQIPGGPTFILDTVKAPYWTIPSSIDIVRTARAPRRTMIFGTISDYSGSSSKKYLAVAREALHASDRVLFVGRNSARVARLEGEWAGKLRTFASIGQARDFLLQTAIAGELIYVKTSGIDHLERLLYNWQSPIHCWVDECGKSFSCDFCKRLHDDGRTRRTGFNPDAWPVHSDSGA